MPAVDLLKLGLLPPLPSAYLRGEAHRLLEPLRFLGAGDEPTGPPPVVDRADLAEALATANEGWGHPRAREMAARLADPETLVVVTGQQPGMLGGPLYALSKAMAAARWAARLEEQGRPAVAVFWAATEDHDFAEVAQAVVPGREELDRWSLGEDPAPLAPVGGRSFGSSIEEILESWRVGQGSADYSAWIDRVAAWYRSDSSFGDAFCRISIGMMGEHCPLLLDSMAPAVKQAQRAGLQRLVTERVKLEEELSVRDEQIEELGFPLQVRPQRGTSPLFLVHDGERRRIEWREEDRFSLRGLEGFEESVEWLQSLIADTPERVSPGVLARSAIQDSILGTHLQILGPGELAYIAQAAPTYSVLGIAAPWVSLRPQVLVLAGRQRQQAEDLGLSIEDLVTGRIDVSTQVATLAGEDFVAPIRQAVEQQMEGLREPTLALDKSLETPLEKTTDQMRRALDTFGGKVAAAAARRHEVTARRVEALVGTIRPDGALQERVVSGAHFVGKYPRFVDALWDQLELDPQQLHLIDPERRVD